MPKIPRVCHPVFKGKEVSLHLREA